MNQARRIQVAWEPRPDGVETSARQLVAIFDWLRTLPALEGPWTTVDEGSGAAVPCETEQDAGRALVVSAQPVPTDGPPPEGAPRLYQQVFYQGSFRRWRARIVMLCGMRAPFRWIEAPNRFELSVREDLSPEAARQAMVGLIGILRPVAGFVGSESVPPPPPPDAVPDVGWLTYLSAWFGSPAALPAPALVSPMQHLGTLYQAFPGSFDPANGDHRHDVEALRRALGTAGVLRPYQPTTKPPGGDG